MKQTRFQFIRNEAEKQNHLKQINQKSKLQSTIFQNPFFQQQQEYDEENEKQLLLSKVQQLEENQVVVVKDVNVQVQHKVKSHIIDHKLKNNYDFIRLKYLVRIWRENSLKLKIEDEVRKNSQLKENKENLIEDLIRNQKYESLKQQQILLAEEVINFYEYYQQHEEFEKDNQEDQELLKFNQKDKMEGLEEKKSFFKMPEPDLLQYIPYCTDIYLGKD